MRSRATVLPAVALMATMSGACDGTPGRPPVEAPVPSPEAIVDFTVLYGTHCGGCHGPNGEGGVALGLANPIYLEIADEATLRRVTATGVSGTAMPAFARSAGGTLTDTQIEVLVHGIRTRWARPRTPDDPVPPPYSASALGDPARGADAYGRYCASCHGVAGRGGPRAGSIVDAAYLALVSDQNLRTTVIAGRPDLGHPDWRAARPGMPMSPEDVSDVAAWLSAQRPRSTSPQSERPFP